MKRLERDAHRSIGLRPRGSWMVIVLALLLTAATGCGGGQGSNPTQEVVVYTALDQIYSEPILNAFQARSGITTRVVYDSEASKTVGLVNRIVAERDRPRCDVFWNNEIIRTIQLQHEGLLEPYISPNAADIPVAFKDAEGNWTGFAARARVLAWNTARVNDPPRTIRALTEAQWRGRFGIAYPLFGTTATHFAVLQGKWGEAAAQDFFKGLQANEVKVLDGNMAAARAVADGELDFCLTDTDDANLLRGEGKPIDFLPLDHDGEGALLIPNTVSLIKGAPHPEAARQLIDYLLLPEVEAQLAASPSGQIPLHPGVPVPPSVEALAKGPFFDPEFAVAADVLQPSAEYLKGLFGR